MEHQYFAELISQWLKNGLITEDSGLSGDAPIEIVRQYIEGQNISN